MSKIKSPLHSILLAYLLMACTFCCCQNQTENESVEVKKTTTNASISTQDNKVVTANKRNYVKDVSRATNDMVQQFPFDITVRDKNDKHYKSNDIFSKDKPTVVLFWLTTCPPCKIEMAQIKKKYAGWKEEADFDLVAISTDFEKNYPRFVEMVNQNEWEWETYHDMNREFRKVLPGGLNGLPQTFVFDKDGNIAYHKRKYKTGDEDKLFEAVKELL